MRTVLVMVGVLVHGTSAWSEPVDPPVAYIGFGAVGGVGVGFYDAASVEVGYRPGRYGLWLHAVVQVGDQLLIGAGQEGSEDAITSSGDSAFRVGIDERACRGGDALCVVAGVDVGYLHQYAISQSSPQDVRGAVVVPHLGLDLGGTVRFRPGIEASLGSGTSYGLGAKTIALTAAIGIMF